MEEEEEIFVQMERVESAERDCLTLNCKDFRIIYISFKAGEVCQAIILVNVDLASLGV